MPIKPRVLFPCSEDSCRARMSEAFRRDLAGDVADRQPGQAGSNN